MDAPSGYRQPRLVVAAGLVGSGRANRGKWGVGMRGCLWASFGQVMLRVVAAFLVVVPLAAFCSVAAAATPTKTVSGVVFFPGGGYAYRWQIGLLDNSGSGVPVVTSTIASDGFYSLTTTSSSITAIELTALSLGQMVSSPSRSR